MLFVLTGEVQTGKTRWLLRLIDTLRDSGIESEGVVAPGVWRDDGEGGFEKLGIENRILPDGPTVEFARRAARINDADGQHAFWEFSQDSIAQVNEHFGKLLAESAERADASGAAVGVGRLLVVDELGWMELERGEGLANAMELLDRGPTPRWPHALVVVRASLVSLARERFESAWETVCEIAPNDEGEAAVKHAFRI